MVRGHMNIGIPTEIKPDERRVAITPAGARELTRRGHRVLVERGAGDGAGFTDPAYRGCRRRVHDRRRGLRAGRSRPEGQGAAAPEVERLSEQHTLFTFLHLAADPGLAAALAEPARAASRTRPSRTRTAGCRSLLR